MKEFIGSCQHVICIVKKESERRLARCIRYFSQKELRIATAIGKRGPMERFSELLVAENPEKIDFSFHFL